jgi:hypothetical protein
MEAIKVGSVIRLSKIADSGHKIEVTGTVENVYVAKPVQVKFYGLLTWVAITEQTTLEEITHG